MAANTTETEFPKEPRKPVSNSLTNDEKILALHQKGKNAYSIAKEVYDFDGEEAVNRVAAVIAAAYPEEVE